MVNLFALHEAAVDTSAITANTVALIGDVVAAAVVADVRADGYGHGAVEAARAAIAGGATWLGVSSFRDGEELRNAGLSAPTLSLAGDVPRALEGLTPDASDLPAIFLHGLELYGLSGVGGTHPAMRVSARVVATKTIAAGEGVSYGHIYRATEKTNLALVAIGYANGLDRFASNTGTLFFRGRPRLIAGRVAMNVSVIELGDDHAEVGDEAVVFGHPDRGEPAIGEWAASIRKKPDEVAAVFGSHLPRRYS